jgi:hypothetical protein
VNPNYINRNMVGDIQVAEITLDGPADSENVTIHGVILSIELIADTNFPPDAGANITVSYRGVDILESEGLVLDEEFVSFVVPTVVGSDGASILPRAVHGVLTCALTDGGSDKIALVRIIYR